MTTIPRPTPRQLSWVNLTVDDRSNLTVDEWASLPVVPAFAAWNRLVKLVDNGTGETVQENEYDGRDYRIVTHTSSGARHAYFTDQWQVIEERVNNNPKPDRHFVWGVRYIDDLVLRDRTVGDTLDERLYALQDANWNVTAVADDEGEVQKRYENLFSNGKELKKPLRLRD